MKILFASRALRDYEYLSRELQKAADKQFNFLLTDLAHPSLRAKKYDEQRDIWQARVSGSYRFYFQIKNGEYIIISIVKHPK